MTKRVMLICFMGIDGSGKTTLAKRINEKLKKRGVNSQYLYGRVVPIVSRFLMWIGRKYLLKRRKEDIFHNYSNYTRQKRKIFKNKFISKIYKWSIMFDQVTQINLKIIPRLAVGNVVICDRYVFDTVVTDIGVDLNYSNSDVINLINKLFRIVPKPDITFLIDVPEEIAYQRKNDIPHLSYLSERRKLYLIVGKSLGVITLDGSKSIDEVSEEAYENIRHLLGGI